MNKNTIILTLIAILFGMQTNAQTKNEPLYSPEVEAKAESILAKMTLEEKVGQMTQVTLDVIGEGADRYSSYEPFHIDEAVLRKAVSEYHVGSFLNTANNRAMTPEKWYEVIKNIQDINKEESRLDIPIIYGVDEIHGATYTAGATMFPQQIAQAASRNVDLVERAAEITAYETRASGIPWTFSPVLDLGVDPRFPRMWESFGEDPYLASVMGVAIINGYEGVNNDIGNPYHVASNMKHFLGYHAAKSGKDRTASSIPESALREYHLPPFKAAIDAGSHSIMINSGIINGVPVHANYDLITGLLKNELGFEGLVLTDWADIENLYKRDRVAQSYKEATKMAVNAGIDMTMVPYAYERFYDNLIELVKEGKVKISRINDAVERILKLKIALDLFDNPVTHYKDYPKFGSEEFEYAAYKIASEAITLLKNEGNILPLDKGINVLVTGPNANSMRTLNGGWTYSWQGEKTPEFAQEYHTILEAVQHEIGKDQVVYVPGVSYINTGKYYEQKIDRMDEAVEAASKVDAILLVLGENSYTEKPGDLNDLYLSDLQTQLAIKMAATGKPVILILNEGRPRIISKFVDQMDGVLQTYLPGNFGGDALADILFGDVNPSGKLPYTYPRYPNSLVGYIHKPAAEQTNDEGAYNYESDYYPQFPFGFGLSYTTFDYTDLTIDKDVFEMGEPVHVQVTVTNTGNEKGKEVVEIYTSDLYASSITPDVKRLRGFEKILLAPGESKMVEFTLDKKAFNYVGRDGKLILEPGKFKIMINDLEKTVEMKNQN